MTWGDDTLRSAVPVPITQLGHDLLGEQTKAPFDVLEAELGKARADVDLEVAEDAPTLFQSIEDLLGRSPRLRLDVRLEGLLEPRRLHHLAALGVGLVAASLAEMVGEHLVMLEHTHQIGGDVLSRLLFGAARILVAVHEVDEQRRRRRYAVTFAEAGPIGVERRFYGLGAEL